MVDDGGSVTLVFYKVGKGFDLLKEPFLNMVAAFAQRSSFSHVEIAIGSDAGSMGQISNVCRIFNDDVGVELTSRTGRNPQYSYLSIGCSKRAEQAMLSYAKSLVGKPFSNVGMARSIVYPRQTDGSSFFCAELVASILKRGGLMYARHSNSFLPTFARILNKEQSTCALQEPSRGHSEPVHSEAVYHALGTKGAPEKAVGLPWVTRRCHSTDAKEEKRFSSTSVV